MPELTGAQVITKVSYKANVPKLNNTKLRRMRKDPVIALVRVTFFSGILAGEWSYEGDNPDQVEFIKSQLEPIRRLLLSTGALGCFDFGWQPYEKIYDIDPVTKMTVLIKLKPLIQDNTEILVDEKTGQLLGFKNGEANLPIEKVLLLNFDVEGTDYKGTSTLENAEQPYDSSQALEDAAARFDAKMAGAHWVIKYPDGNTDYNGTLTPNHEIADKILASLQSSGSIAIPVAQLPFQEGNSDGGWDIKLLTADGGTFSFFSRFDYLDKNKVRALGFPERTVFEGTHGTKADAVAHIDFVLTMIEYRHDCLLELINWHLVNQLLELNYGPEFKNMVTVKAGSIASESKDRLAKIYELILANPDGMMMELNAIDVPAIAEVLAVPRVAIDETLPLNIELPDAREPTAGNQVVQ